MVTLIQMYFRPPTIENQLLIDEEQTAIGAQLEFIQKCSKKSPHSKFSPKSYSIMSFEVLIKPNPFENDFKFFTLENLHDDLNPNSMRDIKMDDSFDVAKRQGEPLNPLSTGNG